MPNAKTGFPSIDKPWMKYYQSAPQPVPACTVWRNIYENNKHAPTGIALQYFGKKITYKSLFAKVDEAKRAFIAAGVKRGDNVSFLMLSCPEMVYAILALNQLGAVANMVNPTFTAEQMRDRINDSEAHLIIILDQLYERLAPVIGDICSEQKIIVPIEHSMPLAVKAAVHYKLKKPIPYSASVISWKQFAASGDPSQPDVPDEYIADTPAIMVYSSGTTGASKGIVLTNDGINATIRHYTGPDFDYKRGDTFLHMGASWFSTFMIVCLLMPLRMGITVIIEPVFSEKTFVDGIVKNKPTMTLAAVGLWLAFIHSPKAAKLDLSGMKYPITGGEKVLPETENEINAFLKEHHCQATLLIGYGMCELGSTVVTNSEKNYKQSSAGFPITDVIVSAFDPETNEELPTGQRGEIRVISPCRMKEYYKRPDATAEFFKKDAQGREWGCTGDIGYVDADGFVYVQGRKHDYFINAQGQRVYCFDVEDILLTDHAVDQCEVVGVDHGGHQAAAAFVTQRAGVQIDTSRLMALCKASLPSENVPVSIQVLERFPIKPSGKRDMDALKRLAAEKN